MIGQEKHTLIRFGHFVGCVRVSSARLGRQAAGQGQAATDWAGRQAGRQRAVAPELAGWVPARQRLVT